MKFFAVYGEYCMEIYAGKDREEAYKAFLEHRAFRMDDKAPTIYDLSYPFDCIRPQDMHELTATEPGYVAGYVE